MLTFQTENPPKGTDPAFSSWLIRQFGNIKKAANAAVEYVYFKTISQAPARNIDGEMRIADGTNWDPGFGYGLYFYCASDGQWQRVHSIGTGGTVTQLTDKSTAVELDKPCGEITMNNAALASGAAVTFTLTNSFSDAKSLIVLNHVSGGTIGNYIAYGVCSSGSVAITLLNRSAGSLSNAVVLRFTILPGAIS